MAIDLSPASLIRSGSGLLYLAGGIALVFLATRGVREKRLAWGLAAHAMAYGSTFIAFNLGGSDDALAPSFIGFATVAWVIAAGSLFVVLAHFRPSRGRWTAYVATALAAGVTAWLVTFEDPARWVTGSGMAATAATVYALSFLPTAIALVACLAIAIELAIAYETSAPEARRAHVLLAVAILLYPAYYAAETSAHPDAGAFFPATMAAVFAALFVRWLLAVERVRGPGLAVPLLAAGTLLLGAISRAVFPPETDYGLVGLVRLGAFVCLTLAIFRHDLLGAGLNVQSARRGSAVTVSLAVLFVVAQAAQPVVDSRLGLVFGALAAVGSLFVGGPLQRAWERRAEEGRPAPDRARREDLYLNAARTAVALRRLGADASADASSVAMRDRRLTRAEEAHLHALADELGLGAKRAHELLVQAETEAGVR